MKIFINLTNGIEFIPDLNNHNISFVRIQSSLCERKQWESIIKDLDYNFLLSLALGYKCYVYDCSAKHDAPRAIWQGIPWIIFVLEKIWFGKIQTIPYVKSNNCIDYFNTVFNNEIRKETKKKISYFKKFLITNKINLYTTNKNTLHDGDYTFFKTILKGSILK